MSNIVGYPSMLYIILYWYRWVLRVPPFSMCWELMNTLAYGSFSQVPPLVYAPPPTVLSKLNVSTSILVTGNEPLAP